MRLLDAASLNAGEEHTVKSDNAEDEDNRQSHDDDRVDLEAGRLIGVQPWNTMSAFVQMYGVLPNHGCCFYTQCHSTVHHVWFPLLVV